MTVDYLNDLPIPAFALAIDDSSIDFVTSGDLASAWMFTNETFVPYNTDGIYQLKPSADYDWNILVFNSTALPTANITSPTWQYLYLQANVTCKWPSL